MISFQQFVKERKYSVWVRVTVGTLVLNVLQLSVQIQNNEDPVKQNKLISKQNRLLPYIYGLGIGVGSSDTVLLRD